MMYMGAKWGRYQPELTDPARLLQPNGYTTSSDTVNTIIDLEGLGAFEIVEIVLESEILSEFGSISKYESHRLRERDSESLAWYLNGGRPALNYRSPGRGKQDYVYWYQRSNDHLIDWSTSELSFKWLFQEEDYYMSSTLPEDVVDQQVAIKKIIHFLKTRGYTTIRPEEVGLPPSFKKWRPDVLHQVLHDLTHNLGSILRVQRKRRNV